MSRTPSPSLTGQKIRSWTITGPKEIRVYSKSRMDYYECRCDCGRESFLSRHSILNGAGCCQSCAMKRWCALRRL